MFVLLHAISVLSLKKNTCWQSNVCQNTSCTFFNNQHVSNIKTGNYTKCLATDYLAVVDNFLLITKEEVMCEQDSDKVN